MRGCSSACHFVAGCGVCGGTGVQLDLDGVCCGASGVITPSGYCCASGNVDDAGVCDGTGNTVSKVVGLAGISRSGGRAGRRLQQTAEELEAAFKAIVRDVLGYPEGLFTVVVDLSGGGSAVRTATLLLTSHRLHVSWLLCSCVRMQLSQVSLLQQHRVTRLLSRVEAHVRLHCPISH